MAVKLESLLAHETFEREIECGHGTLKIKQAEVGEESCVVWDAALVLGKYLQKLHLSNKGTKEGLENKRIIELGAGTGVVGLMAAACGAAVCCTDLASVVPLIELNKTVNQHLITGSFSAASLKWGQDVTAFLPCPDILLDADCIYYEESLTPLVTTLCDLSDFNTTVLLSYEERTTGNKPLVEKQFHQLAKAHFSMEEIPEEEQDSIYHSPDIYLWRLK